MAALESNWMFFVIDGAILLCAILFFLLMIVLRRLLAYVFSDHHIRCLPPDFPTPPAFADIFDETRQRLIALGFSGPHWIVLTPKGDTPGSLATLMAVFLHPEQASQAIVLPPVLPKAPNNLPLRFVSWLADGRVLSSQTWDNYAEMVADGKQFFGQTIGGDTVDEQWQAHLDWRERLGGNAPGAPERCAERNLGDSLEYLYADGQRLLASGKTWQDRNGVVRARFGFALKILKQAFFAPKPKNPDPRKTPVARLMLLSAVMDTMQKMPLPRHWEWGMLFVSCLLFAALGSLFFGWTFTLFLLGVLFFHESGHYLAMRALGYKNVQMIALPLAGGVTMGDPGKVGTVRRVWVAMMGPLPGILLGWGLLVLLVFAGPFNGLSGVLLMLAATLLIVNYLNLLPISPLDGGHILQGLLPPRWFGIRILIVIGGCVLAGCLAWFYGLYILAMLAGLQLVFLLPSLSVNQRMISRFDKDEAFLRATPQRKKEMALEALNGLTAKPVPALRLINWANEVVDVFTLQPMKGGQRAVLGFIYAALLAMAVMATWFVWTEPFRESVMEEEDEIVFPETVEGDRQRMATLSFAELLQDVVGGPLSAPAGDSEILETQARLGQPLPEDLQAFYRASNGLGAWAIGPLHELDWIANHPSWQRIARETGADAMSLQSEGKTFTLPLDASGFLYLGTFDEESVVSMLYRFDTEKLYLCERTSCMEQPHGLKEGTEEYWLQSQALERLRDDGDMDAEAKN